MQNEFDKESNLESRATYLSFTNYFPVQAKKLSPNVMQYVKAFPTEPNQQRNKVVISTMKCPTLQKETMGLKMKEQAAASSNSRGMMKPYKMVR
jgi:predicted oxidoreductase (fatty acid repression mutant protein)